MPGLQSGLSGARVIEHILKKMKRIEFFIPFRGCTRRCIYCNQAVITGSSEESTLSPESVSQTLRQQKEPIELCFFGGSFGRLDRTLISSYLKTIRSAPHGSRITFSSYPGDFGGENGVWLIKELSMYPIGTVELGVPSLDPHVLGVCRRDDSPESVIKNIALLRDCGFHIGVQMMIGLPGQSHASSLCDIKALAALIKDRSKPWHLRIYPCLVLKGTELAALYELGEFTPLSLEAAVQQSAALLLPAEKLGFAAIRIGLLNSDSLRDAIIAGPFHPAFGELVLSEKLILRLAEESPAGPWTVETKLRSHLTGHKKRGILRLADLTALSPETVENRINYQ